MKILLRRFVCLSLLLIVMLSVASRVRILKLEPSAAPLRPADGTTQAKVNETYGKLPLSFEANQGQADGRIKFLSRGGNYSFLFAATEATLRLRDGGASTGQPATVRMKFVGANPQARIEGLDELPGKSNYLIGADPKQWRTNVPNYARVRYDEVWPGIDVVFYGAQRRLEYDFVVAPGARPEAIKLAFEGVKRMRVEASGDLVLDTTIGEIRQRQPVIYQEVNGARRAVAGGYALAGKDRVGFRLAPYNRNLPLVIDPLIVYYGSYLSGFSRGIAVDAEGAAYVTGYTSSPDSAASQAFALKINPAGTALVYATYFGGGDADGGQSIAVDAAGQAYVAGATKSSDFPLVNPIQSAYGGGGDAFVAKLNASGSALVYSTYLGGSLDDTPASIGVDAEGGAYVAGNTTSINFPTVNPLQPAIRSSVVFKSADGGNSWTASGAGLPSTTVFNFAVDPATPATVYAATEAGVFKSVNGGADWSATGFKTSCLQLVIDPLTPATLYARLGDSIHKSADGGASWNNISNGLTDGPIHALAIDPKTPTTVYVLVGPKVFKSVDGGGSWIERSVGWTADQAYALAVDPMTPTTLYVGGRNGLFKSVDGGASWSRVENGFSVTPYVSTLAIDPTNPATIYAGIGSPDLPIYKSINGGASWQAAVAGLPANSIFQLVTDPFAPGALYALTNAGIYKSTDRANSWNAINAVNLPRPTRGFDVRGLTPDPKTPGVLYLGFDKQVVTEAFVTKVNPAGSAFVYSTYLGGNDADVATDLAVDAAGNAYVTGWSSSGNFPTTPGVFRSAVDDFYGTVFVTKLNAAGSALGYSTFIGAGYGLSIAIDAEGNAYVTGEALINFPVTFGPSQTINGGSFLTKLNADGAALVYSRGGGSGGASVAVDAAGRAYVGGSFQVNAPGRPNTVPIINTFVNRFSGDGAVITDSIAFSGAGGSIVAGPGGDIYLLGRVTTLGTPPITPGAFQTQWGPGFVLRLKLVGAIATVSAANYRTDTAQESLATIFGSNLGAGSQAATTLPLPTELGGVKLRLIYGNDAERFAPLLFVSPTQINFQFPPTPAGIGSSGSIQVVRDGEVVAAGVFQANNVAPGLFTSDASGRGLATGIVVRVRGDGSQSYEPIVRFDQTQNRFVAVPIDLGPESDEVFLAIFGTGWRFRSSEAAVKVTVGGIDAPVTYAGLQPTLAGVDQINARLPRTLAGKGEADIVVTVDGKTANTVKAQFK